MSKLIVSASDVMASSDAYQELFNKDGLQVFAMKRGRFQIKCGSTHTIAKNLQELEQNIDKLGLHQFPYSGDSVIKEINEKLNSKFRLEVHANKDDKIVHSVEGSKEHIAESIKGMVNADVNTMVAGRRYATNGGMFGGDYMILIPMSMSQMCLDNSFSPDMGDQMYEKQEFAKGVIVVGQNPVDGSTLTVLIDEVYPNGAFKDQDGVVYSKDDIKIYKFEVGRPLSEEAFQEPSDSLYTEEDIPTYNPVGDVEKVAPMIGDLKNYDNILSASAGILSDFMKTAKGVAYIDRSSLNKVKVSAVNKEGQATDGEIEWNVRISSPHYKRSSQITIPMVMKEGSIDLGKEFSVSTGLKYPLTVDAIKQHLGTLIEGFEKKVRGMRYPSTIKADKDVDNLMNGIEPKKVAGNYDWVSKDGKIGIVNTFHDYTIVYIPTGEHKGMGDGVDMFFDEDGKALSPDTPEFDAQMAEYVNDPVLIEACFPEIHNFDNSMTSDNVEGSKKVAEKLPSEDPSPETGEEIKQCFAVSDYAAEMETFQPVYEHGHWWITGTSKDGETAQFDAVDAEGGASIGGFDFEKVAGKKTSGDEFDEWFDKKAPKNEPDIKKEQSKKTAGREYQPKTGEPCSCKPGVQRDNCPACEGTGMRIDFQKIRDSNNIGKKTAGGEFWSDVVMQQEAIESSETPEEAVQKLKNMGYVSTFTPDSNSDRVETIEECVDRIWSLHKDPGNAVDGSKKTAAEAYPESFGESQSDVIMQQEAIEASETQEEAVQALKDMGYVSTFKQTGDEHVETIEELVDRVWSLYKDPGNQLEASKKTSVLSTSCPFCGSKNINTAKVIHDGQDNGNQGVSECKDCGKTFINNGGKEASKKTAEVGVDKKYVLTVKHDNGTVNIQTSAQSEEGAINKVMKSEGCPRSAIVKVKEASKKIALNEKTNIAPDFWIVGIDETDYWADDIKEKVDAIVTYYLYDKNEVTYIASTDGSYLLYPIVTEEYAKEGLSEEERDQLNMDVLENADSTPDYYGEHLIDNIPEEHKKHLGDEGVTGEGRYDGDKNNKSSYEDAIEGLRDHYQSNPPYMPALSEKTEVTNEVKEGSIKTSSFKYTGDWQTDFNDEHPLLPWLVIETAVDSRQDVPTDKVEAVITMLTNKFGQVYKANERWAQEILNGKGNKGRDTFYAFVNHWIDALVKKNFEPSGIMKVEPNTSVEGVEGSKKISSIYVGVNYKTNVREVFNSDTTPTEASHGETYSYVIGPFKTKRGAEFMALYGKNNPHLQHVDDAERISKQQEKKTDKNPYGSTRPFEVYLDGKLLDTVYYDENTTEEDVKSELVELGKNDPTIVVKKAGFVVKADASDDVLNAKTLDQLKAAVEAMGYTVDENNIIKDNGKFEGDWIATLFFYEMAMNGDTGEDELDFGEGEVYSYYKLSPEEQKLFETSEPYFLLSNSSSGFVGGEFVSEERHQEGLAEYEKFETESGEGESFASKKAAVRPEVVERFMQNPENYGISKDQATSMSYGDISDFLSKRNIEGVKKTAGTELWATPDGKYWLLGTTMMEPVSPTFNTKEEAVDYGIKTNRFDPSIRDRVISEEVDGTGEPNDLSSSPDIMTIPMSEIERASEKGTSKTSGIEPGKRDGTGPWYMKGKNPGAGWKGKGDPKNCPVNTEKIPKKPASEKTSGSQAWDVVLDGKVIDTVWDSETDPAEVKRSLVGHDGYDPNITVKKPSVKKAGVRPEIVEKFMKNPENYGVEKDRASSMSYGEIADFLSKRNISSKKIAHNLKDITVHIASEADIGEDMSDELAYFWNEYPNNKVMEGGYYKGAWNIFVENDQVHLVATDQTIANDIKAKLEKGELTTDNAQSITDTEPAEIKQWKELVSSVKTASVYLEDSSGRRIGSFYGNSNFLGTPKDILERRTDSWVSFGTKEEAEQYRQDILQQMNTVKAENEKRNSWETEQERNFTTLTKWVEGLKIGGNTSSVKTSELAGTSKTDIDSFRESPEDFGVPAEIGQNWSDDEITVYLEEKMYSDEHYPALANKTAGGGAGIRFENFEFSGSATLDSKGNIANSDLAVVKFDAHGYDDGMLNVTGKLLKVTDISLSDMGEYSKDTKATFELTIPQKNNAYGMLFGGYQRGSGIAEGTTLDLENVDATVTVYSNDEQQESFESTVSIGLTFVGEDAKYWYEDVFGNYYPKDADVLEWIKDVREANGNPNLYTKNGEDSLDDARIHMQEQHMDDNSVNWGVSASKKTAADRFKSDTDIAKEFEGMTVREFTVTDQANRPGTKLVDMSLEFPEGDESVGGGATYTSEWFFTSKNDEGNYDWQPSLRNWYPEPVYDQIVAEIEKRFQEATGETLHRYKGMVAAKKTAAVKPETTYSVISTFNGTKDEMVAAFPDISFGGEDFYIDEGETVQDSQLDSGVQMERILKGAELVEYLQKLKAKADKVSSIIVLDLTEPSAAPMSPDAQMSFDGWTEIDKNLLS